MPSASIHPQFIVDETGRKSGVLLALRDYERLREAWEEVADAEDFAEARRTARRFITTDNLRGKLRRKDQQ